MIIPCDNQALCSLEVTLDDGWERNTIFVVSTYFFHNVTLKERKIKEKTTIFYWRSCFNFYRLPSSSVGWCSFVLEGINNIWHRAVCKYVLFFSLTWLCFLWSLSLLDWTELSILEFLASGKYCLRENLISTNFWG